VPCSGGSEDAYLPLGCVPCSGNANGGVCTPEEAAFVTIDIAQGNLTGSALKATGGVAGESCYVCMHANQCFDDSIGDRGQECGDVSADAPTLHAENGPQVCLDTLACIIASKCAKNGALIGCYCGTTPPSTCVTLGPAKGPCVSQETDGLDTTNPGSVNKTYSNVSLPAGMANVAFNCAIANGCAKCLE
jgi:hypothetical protein